MLIRNVGEDAGNDMIGIDQILETFGLTRDQVRNSGVDLQVLQYLPELELVGVLSDIASNVPQEEVKSIHDPQSVPAQSHGDTTQNLEGQAENRHIDRPNSTSRIETPADEVSSNPRAADEGRPRIRDQPPQVQSQSDSRQPERIVPPQPIRYAPNAPYRQIENQASLQRESIDNQLLSSFAAELEGLMLGMNAPAAARQSNRPNAPNVGGSAQILQPGPQLRSPVPDPFGGLLNAQNVPQVPGLGTNIRAQAAGEPNPGALGYDLPPEIDPEFLNSLPESLRQELLRNDEMLRRNLGQPPLPTSSQANIANAEQMDTASFLATLTDENLRREILAGMDEQTLLTLPPRIQSEARRSQREILRRHYRREQEDPARILRRIMERSGDNRASSRDARGNQDKSKDPSRNVKYDNFMEIIRRREEKLMKQRAESADISKSVISVVFAVDKTLKNLLKLVIIESQRKCQIKFNRLVKPIEYLCANSIIRLKLNQALMQTLINFKTFANEVQYSDIKDQHIYDHLFPPVFALDKDGRAVEELQHSKIALLVFKIFDSVTDRYSVKNTELIKSFFTKEQKQVVKHYPTWFTQLEKWQPVSRACEDSPFLCLLKYILSDEF